MCPPPTMELCLLVPAAHAHRREGGANFQFYPFGQITSHLGACYCSWHGGILLNEIMCRQGLVSVSPGLLGAYLMETSFFHRASHGDALIPSDTPLLQSTHALCATCIFSSSPLVFHTHPRSHPNSPSFLGRSWRGEVLPFRHLESSRLVLRLAARCSRCKGAFLWLQILSLTSLPAQSREASHPRPPGQKGQKAGHLDKRVSNHISPSLPQGSGLRSGAERSHQDQPEATPGKATEGARGKFPDSGCPCQLANPVRLATL